MDKEAFFKLCDKISELEKNKAITQKGNSGSLPIREPLLRKVGKELKTLATMI